MDDAVLIVRVVGDFNLHRYADLPERRADWLAASSILLEPNTSHPTPGTTPAPLVGDQVKPAA